MIDRRKFSVIAAVGMAVPSLVLAAHKPAHGAQKRSDLQITALRWSKDAGITFGIGSVTEGDDVWFEAVVRNRGWVAWPSGTVLRVDFRVSGQLVTWSDTRTSGLARGASVTLRANTGVGGDKFWIAGAAGTVPVLARADPGSLILEADETNNTRSANLTIQPAPGSTPPTPHDDVASTPVNTAVTIMVLANDTDPLGRPLTVSAVQSPTNAGGTATITADAKAIRYTPPTGFQGQDVFTYEVTA